MRRFYTAEEDALILAKDVPDAVLADRLGRSVASVRVRRGKLSHSVSERQKENQREISKEWRKKHPEQRNARRARNYALGARYSANSRKPWTPEEDVVVMAIDKPTDREISKKLNRTVRAIQTRRGKLKRNKAQ